MSPKGSTSAGPNEQLDIEHRLEARRLELQHLRRAAWLARHPPSPATALDPDTELRRIEVESQLAIIRHSLRTGRVELIRHAARLLRIRDFSGEPVMVETLLGVIRDARSPDDETLEAAARLVALTPAPGSAGSGPVVRLEQDQLDDGTSDVV